MRRRIYITLTVILSCVFILVGGLCFTESYLRLGEACRDFGLSIAFFFAEIFGNSGSITPTVNDYTHVFDKPDIPPATPIPPTFDGFADSSTSFFKLLFSKSNFAAWGQNVSGVMTNVLMVLVIAIPIIIALFFLIRMLYNRRNNDYNRDTVPLRVFKRISNYTYRPIRNFIIGYVGFLRRYSRILVFWIIVWLCNLNLITIIIEFFAYYFYFTMTFDLANIYTQFVKLITDLRVVFIYTPIIAIVVAIILFNRGRRKMALSRLRHMEARNCGFINELPLVSLTCGSMGKKKTTLITDMTLSQEVMFRQHALEILQRNDMKFPHFPWIDFERELCACILHGTVYNLATVKSWVQLKRDRFIAHGNTLWQLYGYDTCRYGFTYYDGLTEHDLFDVLETYAQAYFIYIVESSLIVSNYSIGTDNAMTDVGNFPLWLTDFFSGRDNTHNSHILDFDVLRLGKKVIENNPKAGSFEFGVVAVTEIGKERGNMLELKEIKKSDDTANQKNDLFNSWLKMCRHSATVDNFPFIKFFADEQRPESWGADARDLCDIVKITESGEQRLTYPFYTIEEMLTEWAFNGFMRLYTSFRYNRGDNTLLVHILKTATAWLWKRNVRIYNLYGYSALKLETERGTMDGKKSKKKYFLMNGKIYKDRFCTDCFSDYFNEMARDTHIGLNDYMEYMTTKASVDELLEQNSYFVDSLYGG